MNIAARLHEKRQAHNASQKTQAHTVSLQDLRHKVAPGVWSQEERKKKEKQLHMLLKNALFLEQDEKRRTRWLTSIPHLPDELLENLLGAVIRENFRYKKGKRNLVVELNKKNMNGQK